MSSGAHCRWICVKFKVLSLQSLDSVVYTAGFPYNFTLYYAPGGSDLCHENSGLGVHFC